MSKLIRLHQMWTESIHTSRNSLVSHYSLYVPMTVRTHIVVVRWKLYCFEQSMMTANACAHSANGECECVFIKLSTHERAKRERERNWKVTKNPMNIIRISESTIMFAYCERFISILCLDIMKDYVTNRCHKTTTRIEENIWKLCEWEHNGN